MSANTTAAATAVLRSLFYMSPLLVRTIFFSTSPVRPPPCARQLNTSPSQRYSTIWIIGDLSGGFMPEDSHLFNIQSGMSGPSRLARPFVFMQQA